MKPMHHSSVPDAFVHVPGYTIHRHDRLTGQGGGVCFFVKESIAVRPCLNSDTSEAVFITVLDKRRPVLLLGCVYRPPPPLDLLVAKIAGKLKTFQRLRNSLDNRARRSVYISLIQTSLLYGSNAFSPCLSITHVNRLITISKRVQRISFGYPPSAHTAPIRARHNLIPLDSLLLFKRLVVVFCSLHSLGSCLLDSLFSFRCNSNRSSTVTRAQVTNCLALPDVRTRSGQQSLSYTATKEWNSLPPLIRCVCSQPAFLMHLRNHLGHPVKRLRSVGTAGYK